MAFDFSNYWNPSPAAKAAIGASSIDWGKASQWNPAGIGINTNTDFSQYWDPKGDTAGVPWSQAVQYVPRMAGTAINKYQDQLQQEAQGQQGSGGAVFGGGSVGSGFNQILPGFSIYDPNAGENPWVVGGVQGQASPWAPVASLATGLAGSFLGPIAGAAGGSLAKSLFPK